MTIIFLVCTCLIFLLPSLTHAQAFSSSGADKPTDEDGPVAVAYSAAFFAQPECQGRNEQPVINFGCSAQCFPAGAMRSVMLEGANYLRWTEWKSAPQRWHKWAEGDKENNSIADRGPLAVAYGFSDCRKETLIGRARIPGGRTHYCTTFAEPVFGWSLKLQWMCEQQRNRYNKHFEGSYHEEDYFNWRDPKPGQLEKWQELDELNRAKKNPEAAFDSSGQPPNRDGGLNYNTVAGAGNLGPADVEDSGGVYGSSSGVGELDHVDDDWPSRRPINPFDSDFLNGLTSNSNIDLDDDGTKDDIWTKMLGALREVFPP